MSTAPSALEAALAGVPGDFRRRIVSGYLGLKSAYVDRQFDTSGMRAGKLCEVLLRYLQDRLTGQFIPFGAKVPSFADECGKLEKLPKTNGPESLRVIIPRALNFTYTLRNKRDIGHAGDDIEANEIDAATAVRTMDWCLSELIRVTNSLPLEDAQAILDAIAARQIPSVWAAPGGKKRVMNPKLSQANQALVLLYNDIDTAVPIEDLADWVDNPRLDHFRERVVLPLHAKRLVEFDHENRTVTLTPLGASAAETILAE